MQDTNVEKLKRCFETVFPGLPNSAIPNAAHDTVPEWDSIAHVTLLTLIGEEFSLEIDFEEFEGLTSFPLLLEAVRKKSPNGQ